jgi:hypothetical protein
MSKRFASTKMLPPIYPCEASLSSAQGVIEALDKYLRRVASL